MCSRQRIGGVTYRRIGLRHESGQQELSARRSKLSRDGSNPNWDPSEGLDVGIEIVRVP